MLAALVVVTVFAAVPGISLRVIEDGSPAGPPGAWALGREIVTASEIVDARWQGADLLTLRLASAAQRRLLLRAMPPRIALLVTTADGVATPLIEATGSPGELTPDIALFVAEILNQTSLYLVVTTAGATALANPRFVAALARLSARAQLAESLERAAMVSRAELVGRVGRDELPPAAQELPPDDRWLLRRTSPGFVPRDVLLRWWQHGPEPLRPFAIAALVAFHAPSCLDLLREEAIHAPTTERRGRARLALAAAGDLEQAAFFRARLVNDADADVGVGEAALALSVLGDVGSLDGLRAVAAAWGGTSARVELALGALEQTLAAVGPR